MAGVQWCMVLCVVVSTLTVQAQYLPPPQPTCYAPTVTAYDTVTEVNTQVETAYNTIVEEVVQTQTEYVTETETETEVQYVTETETNVATETEQVKNFIVTDMSKMSQAMK